MEQDSDQNDGLLRQPSSHLSECSLNSNTTLVDSPSSPPVHRHGYYRANSAIEDESSDHGASLPQHDGNGLGISILNEQKRVSIAREPISAKGSPGSTDLLLTPMSAYRPREDRFDQDREETLHSDSNLSPQRPFTPNSDREPLKKSFASTEVDFECRMTKRPEKKRSNWLAILILVLSIYSTVLSGASLLVAIKKQKYDFIVSAKGKLPIATASVIYAATAKSIELSFVTVFVAFVGQALSKRARFQPKGVTIAEMSMRLWVMQPGTMLSHWESVRYAAATKLGVFSLLVALMAMLYTTASDALVAPVLNFGKTESRLMYGRVSTQFANESYIANHCNTPIQRQVDPDNRGETCIQIEHSGQAYHNYMQYLTNWVDDISLRNISDSLTKRPGPVGMLFDNTTLKGGWMNPQNMSTLSETYGRTVDNVTMAMPHAGVVAAAMDTLNRIKQPLDLNGLGTYSVQASVPSPILNVMCANMSRDELTPMVFSEWPSEYRNGVNATSLNATGWPNDYDLRTPSSLTHTAVDSLFGFDDDETHPIFFKLPQPYNTVTNISRFYGHNAIYLLATSEHGTHTMCSMRVAQSPDCYTEYNASASGGSLTSYCGDDPHTYSKSKPDARNGFWEKNWKDVAAEWAYGLSLNAGISDGASAISRLLTQLIPAATTLDPNLPSISEALAVLAGCTLVLSTQDSPFIHYWNYTGSIVNNPQYQAFNATLRTQEYMSGGQHPWQNIFYVVLVAVFATNVFCLLYFAISRGHITDFIEPQNLFSLSLNSPPSAVLGGQCGTGPEKEQYNTSWRIMHDKERDHLYIESSGVRKKAHKRSYSQHMDIEMDKGPIKSMLGKIGAKRTSRL